MSGKLSEMIDKLGLVVTDGAMATELEAMGCNLNDELWSARILRESPARISRVHTSYFEAGADICTSASYQATVQGLMKKGSTRNEAENIIRLSIKLIIETRRAWWGGGRPGREFPLAGASIGPYGAYLADGSEYRAHYKISTEALKEFHGGRMALLRDAGADFFAIETIPSLAEGLVTAELADELGLECWICFSCRNGVENCEGTPIRMCAEAVAKHKNVKAVGVNCTAPQYVESLIAEIKSTCALPVCVYPNTGEDYDPVTKTWCGSRDGMSFRDYAKKWLDAGASIIGGCCRTTPQNIRELRELVDAARA